MSENEGLKFTHYLFRGHILLTLTLNAAGYILLLRHTRTLSGPMYFATTAVLLSEFLKLGVTLIMLLVEQNGSVVAWWNLIHKEFLLKPRELLKMSVPSFIYAIQNNLVFVGLSNLDAATYQVTSQLKIMFTAFFMVAMLGRKLTRMQWSAICTLFIGVALVQLQPKTTSKTAHAGQNYFVGVSAILVYCFCSGFAGVYFEQILKGSDTSFWIRNLQMYVCGIISSALAVFTKDGIHLVENGFFYGYNIYVWIIIVMSSVGGIYASLVVLHMDNIMKSFSASASIILAAIGSAYFFGTHLGLHFIFGSLLVCSAIFMYSAFPKC